MSDLQFQLAQVFSRFADHAVASAHLLADAAGDGNEIEERRQASYSLRTAAVTLGGIDLTRLYDLETVDSINSLLNRLDALANAFDQAPIATIVDVGQLADYFARGLASGDHLSTLHAIDHMKAVLDQEASPVRTITPIRQGWPMMRERVFLADAPPPGGTSAGGDDFGNDGGTDDGGEPGNDTSQSIPTYAHIEIASSMHVGDAQTLTVGIDPQQQANVSGEAMTIAGGYPFDITVTVVAQEFVLRPGETWSNTLHATAKAPNPSVTLHVTPTSETPLAEVQNRTIAVLYSRNAHTLGYGAVRVDVHPAEIPLKPGQTTAARAVMTTFSDQPAFDLTIRINDFGDGSGRLKWTFESPYFAIPPEPVASTIGSAPGDFAAGLIRDVNTASSPKMAALRINGNAQTIARAMPTLFSSVWKQLHDTIPHPIPTVLIVSEDAYVPWELAAVNALFDPSAPPLLGAQADVGRWIFSDRGDIPLPPPDKLDFEPMVEVTAVYTSAKAPRLENAEAEGRELARLYGAKHVDATDVAITDCFHDAQPNATTIHIALHGIYDQSSPVFGLIMVDNAVLTPSAIQGATAKSSPFVFLNACQVGTGKDVLGQYAGMPAAFVYAKARGVVAPLWSVDDGAAKDIALRFYDGLNNGQSPAALLRAERKRAADPAAPSPTSLAYLYYGNPRSKTSGPPVAVPIPPGS